MRLTAALLAGIAGAASGLAPEMAPEVATEGAAEVIDQAAALANLVIALGMFAMLLKVRRYLDLPLGKTATRLKPVVRMFEPLVTVLALTSLASGIAQLWPEYDFIVAALRAALAVVVVWTIIDLRRNRARIETILKD